MPFSISNLNWSVGRQNCTPRSWGWVGTEQSKILFYLPINIGNLCEKYYLWMRPKNLIKHQKDKDEVFIGLYFEI